MHGARSVRPNPGNVDVAIFDCSNVCRLSTCNVTGLTKFPAAAARHAVTPSRLESSLFRSVSA